MEKKNKKQHEPLRVLNDEFPDMTSTVSANECTGMMATPPQNQDELENLQDLFGMEIPKQG